LIFLELTFLIGPLPKGLPPLLSDRLLVVCVVGRVTINFLDVL